MRRIPPANGAHQDTTSAALVRRLVEEACNRGNLAALDAVLPARGPADPAAPDGRAVPPLRDYLAAFRGAVPDARWTIVEQISAGPTVVTRLTVQGTFSGPLLGLAPPGRPATVTGVVISRFVGGRLVSLWLQADLLGLLEQLEVMPQLDLPRAVALAQVQGIGALLRGQGVSNAERSGGQTTTDQAQRADHVSAFSQYDHP